MINYKNYAKVETLEEAWTLNQKKSNRILGGMMWLRLEDLRFDTAIDLSGLGLDKIEETDGALRIGAMVSLHDLESDKTFREMAGPSVDEVFTHIVGVQFRNMATVGGTVFGRFGFSDILTLLLAMDTTVVLYKGGEVPLQDFMAMKKDNDILTHIIVRKEKALIEYQAVRGQKTDFPTFTCCISYQEGKAKLVYGARPGKAKVLGGGFISIPDFSEETISEISRRAAEEISTGSNIKGSGEYRTRLIKGLTKRGLERIGGRV